MNDKDKEELKQVIMKGIPKQVDDSEVISKNDSEAIDTLSIKVALDKEKLEKFKVDLTKFAENVLLVTDGAQEGIRRMCKSPNKISEEGIESIAVATFRGYKLSGIWMDEANQFPDISLTDEQIKKIQESVATAYSAIGYFVDPNNINAIDVIWSFVNAEKRIENLAERLKMLVERFQEATSRMQVLGEELCKVKTENDIRSQMLNKASWNRSRRRQNFITVPRNYKHIVHRIRNNTK